MNIMKFFNLYINKINFVLILALFLGISCSSSDNATDDGDDGMVIVDETPPVNEEPEPIESDFYAIPDSFRETVNYKEQYNVDNSFDTDDSASLQQAIDDLSAAGGGKIFIAKGNYTFGNVFLKSNVHIEVDSESVFRPLVTPGTRQLLMFGFTSTDANNPVTNTSLFSVNGRFTVDATVVRPLGRGFRFCNFRHADGFLASNITILDDHTTFAAFVFNGETINNRAYGPKNGVVKNCNTVNSDFGYGLVQMQLGKNIYFSNIDGDGGTTLRMESHNKNLRTLDAINTLDNVVGRKISLKEGNAAVMLSPHFIQNGVVNMKDITAIHSSYAVRIESGFLTQDEKDFGLTEVGTFNSNSVIKDVKATYSPSLAQHRPDFKFFLPCDLQGNTVTDARNDIYGPSVSAVIYRSNYDVQFSEDDVTEFIDFPSTQPKVVTKRTDCN